MNPILFPHTFLLYRALQPFNLTSLARHESEVAKHHAELSAAKRAEVQVRKFKATEFDKAIVEKPTTPLKPEPKAVTVAHAPSLRVVERQEHYLRQVIPAKMARLTLAERQRMEERQREIEAEEAREAEYLRQQQEEQRRYEAMEKMSVQELRK